LVERARQSLSEAQSNMDLRRLLLHADESDRGQLERLLPHGCCLPREPALHALASEVRARIGAHVTQPGETPLVTVAGTRASLWLLEPRPGQVDFIGSARTALELAERLVSRDLPLWFDPETLPATWSARRLVTGGEHGLDGSSFGLSFCLAFASLMLNVTLPADLIASAAVGASGELEGVDQAALAHKLRLVHDWAPGVRTVLVASDNAEFAERLAEGLGASFRVAAARSLSAAFEVAFPKLVEALEARFSDGLKRQHAARRLFELVRDGSPSLLSWRGVAASCQWLGARLPTDSEAATEARFAEAVARRHAGEELPCPFEVDWVERMPRPLRLRVLAHLIEHSRFHEPSERQAIRELAEAALPTRALDDSAEDLAMLGALGRSYAVFREHVAAERCLRRALRGWRQLGLVEHSSFALSEWIRILGLTERLAELRSLLTASPEPTLGQSLNGLAAELLQSPRASALSRSFVSFALGRAFVQSGGLSDALGFLENSPAQNWNLTLVHLQASRLRWLARALQLSGAPVRACQALAELELLAKTNPEAEFAAVLASIDAVIDQDRDPSEAIHRLRRLEPQAVTHIESQGSTDARELARAIAAYYPY
jgi:hypothetical protein